MPKYQKLNAYRSEIKKVSEMKLSNNSETIINKSNKANFDSMSFRFINKEKAFKIETAYSKTNKAVPIIPQRNSTAVHTKSHAVTFMLLTKDN